MSRVISTPETMRLQFTILAVFDEKYLTKIKNEMRTIKRSIEEEERRRRGGGEEEERRRRGGGEKEERRMSGVGYVVFS